MNLVNQYGDIALDATNVARTTKYRLAAASYGGDKAIFAFGLQSAYQSNLVSELGVVSADITAIANSRWSLAAAGYGGDKAIFAFGATGSVGSPTNQTTTNLISNTGVVASDTSGAGPARRELAAASYGGDKAIFGYGVTGGFSYTQVNTINLVSNLGVVSSDTTNVGTARFQLAAAGYGGDKAIFAYGLYTIITNLVSNLGIVAADVTGAGTARQGLAAAGYGGDKAIFGYGYDVSQTKLNIYNKVSNTGIVSSDSIGVGTARNQLAAASYSS